MSRRPASCFWEPFVVGVAAAALTCCGGTPRETPAPQPVAASQPAATAEPAPTAAPSTAAPSTAAVAKAAPVVASTAAQATPQEPAPPEPAPPPDPNAKPTPKPADSLQWLQDSEARKADYQRRLSESEANLAIANASVADWERIVLELKNPLLPRPKLSPEDAQTIAGMDGGARVRWAEGRLAEARTARDAAQKALDQMKANPPAN
jgi:hypothetical protein